MSIFISVFSLNAFALKCSDANNVGNNQIDNTDHDLSNFYPNTQTGKDLWNSGAKNVDVVCQNTSSTSEEVTLKFDVIERSSNDNNMSKVDYILGYNNQSYRKGEYVQLADNIVLPGETKRINIPYYYTIQLNSAADVVTATNTPSQVEVKLLIGERTKIDSFVPSDILSVLNLKNINFPRCQLRLNMQIIPPVVDFGDVIFDGVNGIVKRKEFGIKFIRDIANGCNITQLNDYHVDVYFSTPKALDSDDTINIGNGLGLTFLPSADFSHQSVKFNQPHRLHRIVVPSTNNSSISLFRTELHTNSTPIQPGRFDVPVTINVEYH